MTAHHHENPGRGTKELPMRPSATHGRPKCARPVAFAATLAMLLAGCAGGPELPAAASLGASTSPGPVTTGSIGAGLPKPGAGPGLGSDPAAAIQMARSLRRSGDRMQAYQMLERAAAKMPGEAALSVELGLAALELGRLDVAEKRLRLAVTAGSTDWRIHMGLATALAGNGRHDEARGEFAKALALSPGNPAILNNLAMARSMAGDRAEAEQLLVKASAHPAAGPQVKQNLALVLSLNGKLGEAERIVETTVPKAAAPATIAYLRSVAKSAASQRPATPAARQPTPPAPAPAKAAAAPATTWAPAVVAASDKR